MATYHIGSASLAECPDEQVMLPLPDFITNRYEFTTNPLGANDALDLYVAFKKISEPLLARNGTLF